MFSQIHKRKRASEEALLKLVFVMLAASAVEVSAKTIHSCYGIFALTEC